MQVSPAESPRRRESTRSRRSSYQETESVSEDSCAGLGLSFYGAFEKACQSVGGSQEDIEHAFSSYFDQTRTFPWNENSSNPSLTFSTEEDLAGTSSLDTPTLSSSMSSSDSLRRARSIQVLRGNVTDVPRLLASPSEANTLDSAMLRRTRSKTVSDAAFTRGKGRLHKQKRHAIYADSGMKLALSPPEDDSPFPVAVVVSSEGDESCHTMDFRPNTSGNSNKRNGLSLSDSKASIHDSSRRVLHPLNTNAQTAPLPRCLLTVPPGECHKMNFTFISPLKVVKKRNTMTRSMSSRNLARTSKYGERRSAQPHPIVTTLLRDLDIAIREWQFRV